MRVELSGGVANLGQGGAIGADDLVAAQKGGIAEIEIPADGSEFDASIGTKFAKRYGVLFKAAWFNGEPGSSFDDTTKLFTSPSKKETEDYITGRFG